MFRCNLGIVDEKTPVARLIGRAEDRGRDALAGRTGKTVKSRHTIRTIAEYMFIMPVISSVIV